MKLQQLRYLREVVRRGLNVSEAAEALYTSQPGISKQIRMLEDELGVQILVRHGKRVVDLTEPGRIIVDIADRMLQDAESLRAVGREFGKEDTGTLTIATTPTQARYALPAVVERFIKRHPRVRLSLREGSPEQIAELVTSGGVDLGIVTENYPAIDTLVMLPCYQWNRAVVTPARHPLLNEKPLTLEAIARFPIVTYDFAFNPESPIRKAFDARNLKTNIALTAVDADVIKVYVELGVGIGILAKMAFDAERDSALRLIDAGHLFEPSTTRIAVRRNAYLRRYVYDFVELFAPHLSRAVVEKTMRGPGTDYEL
ncbi:MAG: LysR family transcriptional regulator, cys regulon transcriptional activator [Betaproteobacteria bacterium]|jgi:LysR family cys regulon transcriptional activator